MMLPPEPLVGSPLHPFRLLRKGLRHVRAPSEPLPYGLCFVECPVHCAFSLALVDEVVAMTAQEVAPRSVKDRHPPAATRSGTDKPRPLPTEVARCRG